MKKILKMPALLLVIVAAVFVCTSCEKKEETKAENIQIRIRIVNQLSEAVKEIQLETTEKFGMKQEWKMGNVPAGAESSMTITTLAEEDAPDITACFTTVSGQGYETAINTKGDKTITLKADPNGGIVAEIVTD